MNKTAHRIKVNARRATTPSLIGSLDSDSIAAFFIPWPKTRPPVQGNIQTGRTVTPSEFYLFKSATLLLVTGLGLTCYSLWTLFAKFPFAALVDDELTPNLSYFTLPAAVFCLPCCWLIFSVHNDNKTRRFLSLVLLIMIFTILLLAVAVYMGSNHRFRRIQSDKKMIEQVRKTLHLSLSKYPNEWNKVQKVMNCCGIDNYSDWLVTKQKQLPDACCLGKDNCNSTSSPGCLTTITTALASRTCLVNGINCVALFTQSCTFIIITTIYFCGKRKKNRQET